MLRNATILGMIAALLFATPVFAVSTQEKQKTCKFGADDQKLKGKARSDFIKKCMADDEGSPEPAAPPKPPGAQ